MLSSNLLSLIAIATFALTSTPAAAAAIKPRADSNSNKVCPNVVYNTPQCCVPNDSGLAEPDCITPASAATASDLKASCEYGEKSEAMCCSVPSDGVKALCKAV